MSDIDDLNKEKVNSTNGGDSKLSQSDPQIWVFPIVLPIFREIVEGNLLREIHRDRVRSIEYYPKQMMLFVRNCRDRILEPRGEDDSIEVEYLSKLCIELENLIELASTEPPEAWCSRTAAWFKIEFSEHLNKSLSGHHLRFNEISAAQKQSK